MQKIRRTETTLICRTDFFYSFFFLFFFKKINIQDWYNLGNCMKIQFTMKIDQNYRDAKRPKITRIYWSYMTLLSVEEKKQMCFPSTFFVINLSFLRNMETTLLLEHIYSFLDYSFADFSDAFNKHVCGLCGASSLRFQKKKKKEREKLYPNLHL